tara:strand:- start:749 stop:1117 length:369 start_codon:yes stop_codon:yes gene_type:complete
MEKQILNDKSKLLVTNKSKLHQIRVAPDSDEYLNIWIKEPTFLQLEQAQMKIFNVNMQAQDVSFDIKEVYEYLWDAFVDKTEPHLSHLDVLRLNAYVGNQIKAILPDPFTTYSEVDEDLKVE